jgi:solute carrier family 8 (sodium/calcium exchanger)
VHGEFKVETGTLGFAITILLVGTVFAAILLQVRRHTRVFAYAELGGPRAMKLLSTAILWGLWVSYVTLSVLQSYEYIKGF